MNVYLDMGLSNSKQRKNKTVLLLLLLVLIIPLILTGCQSKEDQKEVIKELEKVQENKKEQSVALSDKIVENMKENTKEQFEQVFEVQEQESDKLKDTYANGLTFDEEMDRVIDNVGGMGWRTLFKIIFALSDNALPGSFICLGIGLIFAWFFRKNKVAFKFYIILAVVGPLIFILSVYLPPAMIQFYK